MSFTVFLWMTVAKFLIALLLKERLTFNAALLT